MKHLGDITKIDGRSVPRCEVVIGGSPCQDLSVAGKRAGLAGERSGLFMDQIRVIKEMRKRDIRAGRTGTNVFPRYMVWENVPGAFSSNGGEDFRAVLEETARVIEQGISIPRYEGGRWTNAGAIIGDHWSIAWRTHDAQYWGVPQRRRRISLVADFGGLTAPEILFESKSLYGDPPESREEREGTPSDSEDGTYPTVCGTLIARMDGSPEPDVGRGGKVVVQSTNRVAPPTYCIQGNCIDRADTAGCNGKGWTENVSYTLNTIDRPAVVYQEAQITSKINKSNPKPGDPAPTLSTDPRTICVEVYDARGNGKTELQITPRSAWDGSQICSTLTSQNAGGRQRMPDKDNFNAVVDYNIVRRLTPTECERLQGYPDGWTDIGDWTDSKGKKRQTSDAARYRALGNSIALPFWRVMLSRLIRYCREGTMASLFDGIGGFPLCWGSVGGETLWASEIEEFPIAVTKRRFGEE